MYLQFLKDVDRMSSLPVGLLCAACLGQQAVVDLGKHGRAALVAALTGKQQDLSSKALDELTEQYWHIQPPVEQVHNMFGASSSEPTSGIVADASVDSTGLIESDSAPTPANGRTMLPANVPQSFVAIEFRDLLVFLQEYESTWSEVVVTCPWNGVPLPYIDVESAGLNGKLELSVEMTLALIHFLNNLSRGSKVPD